MSKEYKPLQITIPHVIYSDRTISATAKLILGEILNLLKVGQLTCWASNDHFAEMFGLERANVSYHIQQLEKAGWIKSTAVKKCKLEDCNLKSKGWHRHIEPEYPLSKILDSLSSRTTYPIKNTGEAIKNTLYPIKSVGTISNNIEIYKENNIENISTNVDIEAEPQSTIPVKSFGREDINQVIAYFLAKMDIPKEDCSIKLSRQYWNLLLRESKTGVDGVKWLINIASEDEFYRNHITSSKDLYYKRIKLVAQKRGNRPKVAVMT